MFAAPADRNALRVVAAATLASKFVVTPMQAHYVYSWNLIFPILLETLTVVALVQFGYRNRTAYLQAVCLAVAWIAHVFCLIDIKLNTDIVYSNYETILYCVAASQVLVCFQTLARCGSLVTDGIASFLVGHCRSYHNVGVRYRLHAGETETVI